MNIIKTNDELEIFGLEDNKYLLDFNISCFKFTDAFRVDFNIFAVDFVSDKYLIEYYSEINELIAINFQSNLVKSVEKWNLYIFYFVHSNVDSNIKKIVEQDKYATRKLVIENCHNNLTDEEKIEVINKKLFKLEINESPQKIIEEADNDINRIMSIDEKLEDFIKDIIESKHKKNVKRREWIEGKLNSFLGVEYGE